MKLAPVVVAAAAMLAVALPARAEILATGSVSGGQGTTNSNGTWVPVRLNGDYYSVKFTTSAANTMVRVIYAASCYVVGTASTLAVKIQIDGLDTTAWSSGSYFCSPAPAAYTGYSGVVQGTLKVAHSGTHTVTVYGYGINSTYWGLNYSSTVVDR